MANIRSLFTFQPTIAGNVTSTMLVPTPGQLGTSFEAGQLAEHANTHEQSDYTYPDGYASDQLASPIRAYRARGMGQSASNPLILHNYIQPLDPEPEMVDWGIDGMHGGSNVGKDEKQLQVHGPVYEADIKAIPTATPSEQPVKWWKRLLSTRDSLNANSEKVLTGMGQTMDDDGERSYIETDAAIAATNAFVFPDIRRTFDTPLAPGVPLGGDGKPEYDKAGYPLTRTDMESSPYKVESNRVDPQPPGGLAILSDRVRAGAADPSGSRPAAVRHWLFYRPFDKLMSDNLVGIKGVVNAPHIARPIETRTEAVSFRSRFGIGGPTFMNPAPGMTPIGVLPNTDRQVPTPWDADLVVSAPATSTVSGNRWGLR